jgi:NTE family protein
MELKPGVRPRIGLALGSGSARGWAHIGVIQALRQAGVQPDIICGTSIGALVGAACAAGELESFGQWVSGLGVTDVLSFMDVGLSGGMLKGERLMDFFRKNFIDRPIEDLNLPFAAVATALESGNEVWLRSGSTIDAVRASLALPGLFSPVWHEGRLLVDGGLVNPVPVSLARAMGADIVIAVDLNSDILGRHLNRAAEAAPPRNTSNEWLRKLQDNLGSLWPDTAEATGTPQGSIPSVLNVIASSLNIMQVRITRSRMAGDPPDIIISPRLAHLGLLDFHRAKAAIEAGKNATQASIHALTALGIVRKEQAGT